MCQDRLDRWNFFCSGLADKELPICRPLLPYDGDEPIKDISRRLNACYRNVLLLGIGGSALGARTLLQFFRGPCHNLNPEGRVRLFILDNIDPAWIRILEQNLDFRETALLYISKSGSTPETAALFLYFYQRFIDAGGKGEDIVIVTDPAVNGINRIARRIGATLIASPPEVPGRYSVLSAAGLLPAELLGIDSSMLLNGARRLHDAVVSAPPARNPLALLGMELHDTFRKRGRSQHVLFNYSTLLGEFGRWFEQLWAESLGKAHNIYGETVNAGTTPLACTGATDQHSMLQLFREGPADKVFGFVYIEPDEPGLEIPALFTDEIEYGYFGGQQIGRQMEIERLSTEIGLVKSGHPCYSISLPDRSPESLGALLYFYQVLVVWMARLSNVNPFDQPGVEEGKRITYALMGRADYSSILPQVADEIVEHKGRRQVHHL